MWGNSSSSTDSFVHPHNSSIISFPSYLYCFISKPSSFIFITFSITNILLLLPLCIFILHHGLQQWRQKRSTSSAATVSHSDIFTYHIAVMGFVRVFGCVLSSCATYMGALHMILPGLFLVTLNWYGETFFHVLTCVERYLAVVHPITYLSLRNQRGIRIRNISITCVWLLSFAGMSSGILNESVPVAFALSLSSLTIISFCSLSVLCVLIRPGPGEQGGGRERVDRSKLRAFYTIMSILGALLLRFSFALFWGVLHISGRGYECITMSCEFWVNLPSSLVLPLLFLHRAGKLGC